jgi:hypothetical protein
VGIPTQDAPEQRPLTLVMPIASAEDCSTLQKTLTEIQFPPERNPISMALDTVATVHFARFVFFGTSELAVITEYDGDFDTYINDFIDKLGPIFDALLEHVADKPATPVREHRDEFLEYVRRHDLPIAGSLYSAFPQQTVVDITAQNAP